MAESKYPKLEEITPTFELRDGVLWRWTPEWCSGKDGQIVRGGCWEEAKTHANDGGRYCRVWLNNRRVSYHVVAWVLAHGNIPDGYYIDHIDGNRTNNMLDNLRLATNRENQCNQWRHRAGHVAGTTRRKDGKYSARVTVPGGKYRIDLGEHKSVEFAGEVYKLGVELIKLFDLGLDATDATHRAAFRNLVISSVEEKWIY
jgi:hypothetical protein